MTDGSIVGWGDGSAVVGRLVGLEMGRVVGYSVGRGVGYAAGSSAVLQRQKSECVESQSVDELV